MVAAMTPHKWMPEESLSHRKMSSSLMARDLTNDTPEWPGTGKPCFCNGLTLLLMFYCSWLEFLNLFIKEA